MAGGQPGYGTTGDCACLAQILSYADLALQRRCGPGGAMIQIEVRGRPVEGFKCARKTRYLSKPFSL
jgi:hypothetical protein